MNPGDGIDATGSLVAKTAQVGGGCTFPEMYSCSCEHFFVMAATLKRQHKEGQNTWYLTVARMKR